MTEPHPPDPADPRKAVEIEVEPTVASRVARSLAHARILRTRVENARVHHSSLDLGFSIVERDSSIGGGLLAGALAYRLFVLLLPSALLFVSGLGLYAGAADKSRLARSAVSSAVEATGEWKLATGPCTPPAV